MAGLRSYSIDRTAALHDGSDVADEALCPKCGHALHYVATLQECPWWRLMVGSRNPWKAFQAIAEITVDGWTGAAHSGALR